MFVGINIHAGVKAIVLLQSCGLGTSTLGNPWRRLALPKRIENWSLTSLQQRLVKTGDWLVKHARYS